MNYQDELTEEAVERLTDYITAGAYCLRTRNGFRIPALVVEQWRKQGYAVLQTTTLAKRYGVGRKTMWNTIAGCVKEGFIEEVGRTAEGRAMYVPIIDRGDQWRVEHDRRMAANDNI